VAAALLAWAAAAAAGGCGASSITQAERPLVAAVYGRVLAPDGAPVAGAAVHVDARRADDMRLVSSASTVTNAKGEFNVSMQTRGFEQLRAIAFVRATPPAGTAAPAGYTHGPTLFFGDDGWGAATQVDVTLGKEVVVIQE
jgi:hypothetical protein